LPTIQTVFAFISHTKRYLTQFTLREASWTNLAVPGCVWEAPRKGAIHRSGDPLFALRSGYSYKQNSRRADSRGGW